MNKLYRHLAMLSVAAFLATSATPAQAQRPQGGPGGGRGGFDPSQFMERMMERYRDQLKVTDDDEWAIISKRITAVMSARRDAGSGFGGFGRSRGGGSRGGGGERGGRGGGERPGAAETDALRKAIDEKAGAAVIKDKLAAVRKVRAAGQAKLVKTQKSLKEVLNVSQEASAVMVGLIP